MIYRTEYPRPQLRRLSYECLNGEWGFTMDTGESLKERGLFNKENYERTITVPFCPESPLSGIGCRDFMNAVAYRREFFAEGLGDARLLLHFGACDYETEVYVNEKLVGIHKGGYTSFCFEIQDMVVENASNVLTVYVKDNNRTGKQPRGKQCPTYDSRVCDYTRTTGIWQTVWLERTAPVYITRLKLTPDRAGGRLFLEAPLNTWLSGRAVLNASLDGHPAARTECRINGRCLSACLSIPDVQEWEPDNPVLYDLSVTLFRGEEKLDEVESYFGMRDISFDGKAFLLNGRKTFLRLVLDQGFYPEGIYTAPDEEALYRDILLAKRAGFHGARLHQKVFEERFLYHCDRLGYLVFGEFPDAGLLKDGPANYLALSREWTECMQRDYSHPSIIGWCPLNETGVDRDGDFLHGIYELTRGLDPFRPVIDASGFVHAVTDIFDVHNYEQDTAVFAAQMEKADTDKPWVNFPDKERYGGQPYFVSEYGGIWWSDREDGESWGYGQRPRSEEEFYERFEGLTQAVLSQPGICGFCYTQLTDVEQEKNGIYRYDRSDKVDIGKIREINRRPAAIEGEQKGNGGIVLKPQISMKG